MHLHFAKIRSISSKRGITISHFSPSCKIQILVSCIHIIAENILLCNFLNRCERPSSSPFFFCKLYLSSFVWIQLWVRKNNLDSTAILVSCFFLCYTILYCITFTLVLKHMLHYRPFFLWSFLICCTFFFLGKILK